MEQKPDKEATILELVDSLFSKLGMLNMKVDNLVRRVPPDSKISPTGEAKKYTNVFDEIINSINRCIVKVREVDGKILTDICKKVQ